MMKNVNNKIIQISTVISKQNLRGESKKGLSVYK